VVANIPISGHACFLAQHAACAEAAARKFETCELRSHDVIHSTRSTLTPGTANMWNNVHTNK
jgi:hypothetical protein